MEENLEAFIKQFQQDVIHEASGTEDASLREETFTDIMLASLEDLEEFDDAFPCHFKKPGMKVDGYALMDDGRRVELIVAHYMAAETPTNVPPSVLQPIAKRARGFLEAALKGLHKNIEPSTAAWDLSHDIYNLREEIDAVRITIITDGVVKDEHIPSDNAGDIRVDYQVWDLERLHRAQTSGVPRARTLVNFSDYTGPIPVLGDPEEDDEFTTYLAVIPGEVLADLYDTYGSRLLERNVRSFLERRAAVNKGIRQTILEEPQNFLIYNNGITATAENVELVPGSNRTTFVSHIADLQVVNGGQTTASLFHTRHKDKADLSRVRVQMKLTVVHDREHVEDIVARISRYSNTQNRISLSDLSSNHPFHRRVEELSRTTWAPDPEGGKKQSQWYYERARGSYNNDLFQAGTPAAQRRWKATHPRKQKFDKTQLAKLENAWNQYPFVVARGAQKSFQAFMNAVKEKKDFVPDEKYFQHVIAKQILFKEVDAAARRAGAGSYKAHIVAYTLSLLSHLTGQRLNLDDIWEKQAVTAEVHDEIESLTKEVLDHVLESAGNRNVTEWTKRPECWQGLLDAGIHLGHGVRDQLVEVGRNRAIPKRDPETPTPDEAQRLERVMAFEASAWKELAAWGKETQSITSKERGVAYKIGQYMERGWRVTPPMAWTGLKAMDEAQRLGFRPTGGAQ